LVFNVLGTRSKRMRGSGVIHSDRAKRRGSKDKGKSDAYIQSIDSSW
jgi:hypothetical protein